ncbi:DNA topology modulation protein [Terribacillus sp. 179-K 1B1 HS]|uniref:DNA topology modulation protein n=1 Tax=Terribacillus sp. 179-K 1B1 HS TaxID=3142388 RepID=UPI0039A3B413
MKKIAIVGSGGSGKSTLARKLGQIVHMEVWHLDAILWKPGWTLTPRKEQEQIQSQLVSRDTWIIDGNYNGTLDIRLKAADTIIFLDMPRILCLYRVLKRRMMHHNRSRPDMQEGCKEKIDMEFLKWVWQFPADKRQNLLDKLAQLEQDKHIIILKSRREVKRFLEKIKDQV